MPPAQPRAEPRGPAELRTTTQQHESFNEKSSKADNLRRDWTRCPPRGSHPQGLTYTRSQTHTHSYTSLTRAHTREYSHSLPFQAILTKSLPCLFLNSKPFTAKFHLKLSAIARSTRSKRSNSCKRLLDFLCGFWGETTNQIWSTSV